LGVLGLILAIGLAIFLDHYFDDSEAEGGTVDLASQSALPLGFNWKTYLHNNPDLGLAGINTEEKAKQHWLEYGKNEGRNYRIGPSAKPPGPIPGTPPVLTHPVDADAAMSAELQRLAILRSVSRVSLAPPTFDPMNLRERYNKILQQTGIKTKEEAMNFSLDFWEKRRKAYYS